MKVCNNCKTSKPLDDYYTVSKRSKPTIFHICKDCCAVQKLKMKAYYRDWELKKKYGVSIEEYKQQCETRENVCDICATKTDTMHVDHNHKTSKVRGYLCGSCNRGIGLLKDSPEVLRLAAEYLEKNN